MQTKKWGLVVGLGLLLAFNACNFSASTANISSLKIGTDKEVTKETSTFAPGDTIYGVAVISNAPGKVKATGRLVIEDVPGERRTYPRS